MLNGWMTLLFPFLDFLPFAIPRYHLFQDKLRLPFPAIVALIVGISVGNSAIFYAINLGGLEMAMRYTTLVRYSFLLLQVSLSFLLIKDSFSKNMFTWLLMMSYSFFIFGNANFIESRWFWDFSDTHPYLVYNIARILLLIITYPFMLHFLNHTIRNALSIEDANVWKFMWKIPLFSTLFGMLYCTVTDIYAYASWQFLISRYLMLLGSCYVSYVLLRILNLSKNQTRLEEALLFADRTLKAQRKQYENLSNYMEETRRARHDLRQHLAVVERFIHQDDRDGLSRYISNFRSTLPLDAPEIYCRNDVVNALVCCYGEIARQHHISFEARVGYPDDSPITDTDAAVLFGNLLENAVEACQRQQTGKKFIRLSVEQVGGAVVVALDNSFCGEVRRDGAAFLSSKHGGTGIGTFSITTIAQKYHGVAEFKMEGQVFSSSIFLNPGNDASAA